MASIVYVHHNCVPCRLLVNQHNCVSWDQDGSLRDVDVVSVDSNAELILTNFVFQMRGIFVEMGVVPQMYSSLSESTKCGLSSSRNVALSSSISDWNQCELRAGGVIEYRHLRNRVQVDRLDFFAGIVRH